MAWIELTKCNDGKRVFIDPTKITCIEETADTKPHGSVTKLYLVTEKYNTVYVKERYSNVREMIAQAIEEG